MKNEVLTFQVFLFNRKLYIFAHSKVKEAIISHRIPRRDYISETIPVSSISRIL